MGAHAMTVHGPVDVESLGLTLPHEHILFDATPWLIEPEDERKRGVAQLPVSIEIFGELLRDPTINRDNLTFFDEDVAQNELRRYREAGGETIVDVTPPELGRDPSALRRLSELSGVNVIAGTGHYLQSTHPPEVAEQSPEEIATWMIDEIRNGIGDTGVQPGVIGEIGVTSDIHPDERKVLQAAAIAESETGLPISIHSPIPYERRGLEIVDILEDAGARVERVIIGHMSHTIGHIDYHRSVADTGATLEYDRFGAEFYYESWGGYREPRDIEVMDVVARLVEEGYSDRILLSHDVCFKIQLSSFGGYGFAHVPYHIVSYLRDGGVSDSDIERMTIGNPARLFGLVDGGQ